jgi:chromosome segregation ATPase
MSPLTPESRRPSEGGFNNNHRHSLSSPKSPQITSRFKHGLLSELSWAQSLTARLRRDRDNWRSLALKQEQDLEAAHRDLEIQARSISEVEEENAKLRFRHEEDITAGRQLYSRFQVLISKHDKLVDQFNDAIRNVARLKKSDRTKDKVQQRNLRLKATLQRYTSQGTSATTQAAADTEATLREALALASERIEELETKGDALLDALERRNDSYGSDDDEEMRGDDAKVGTLETGVAFRGVLDDESFKEQKVIWLDLLDD